MIESQRVRTDVRTVAQHGIMDDGLLVLMGVRSCEYRSTVHHSCREGKPKAISELKCRASLVAQMVKNLPATWET